jgi:hypothetical protein
MNIEKVPSINFITFSTYLYFSSNEITPNDLNNGSWPFTGAFAVAMQSKASA